MAAAHLALACPGGHRDGQRLWIHLVDGDRPGRCQWRHGHAGLHPRPGAHLRISDSSPKRAVRAAERNRNRQRQSQPEGNHLDHKSGHGLLQHDPGGGRPDLVRVRVGRWPRGATQNLGAIAANQTVNLQLQVFSTFICGGAFVAGNPTFNRTLTGNPPTSLSGSGTAVYYRPITFSVGTSGY